jgi:hypothetical protein
MPAFRVLALGLRLQQSIWEYRTGSLQPCAKGVHRTCDGSGQGVLVFHAFVKKTRRTPPLEFELARKRLKELLDG